MVEKTKITKILEAVPMAWNGTYTRYGCGHGRLLPIPVGLSLIVVLNKNNKVTVNTLIQTFKMMCEKYKLLKKVHKKRYSLRDTWAFKITTKMWITVYQQDFVHRKMHTNICCNFAKVSLHDTISHTQRISLSLTLFLRILCIAMQKH